MKQCIEIIRRILKDDAKRKIWMRAMVSVCAAVVFVTTYLLILPAITVEKNTADQVGMILEQNESATEASDPAAEPVDAETDGDENVLPVDTAGDILTNQTPELQPEAEPEDVQEETQPVDQNIDPETGEVPEAVDPAGDAEVTEPAENVEVTEPAEDAEVAEPAENAEVTEPVEDAEVTEPAEHGEVIEPAADAEVIEPAENADAELTEPAEGTDVTEPAEETESTELAAEEAEALARAEEEARIAAEEQAAKELALKELEKAEDPKAPVAVTAEKDIEDAVPAGAATDETEVDKPIAEDINASEEDPSAKEIFVAGTLTSVGDDYEVTVSYNEDACITARAELSVSEIFADDELYGETLEAAEKAVSEEMDKHVGLARMFDITILDGEKIIEPDDKVKVTITLMDEALAQEEELTVLHEHEDEEIMLVADVDFESTVEEAVLSFETESFSTYVIVSTKDIQTVCVGSTIFLTGNTGEGTDHNWTTSDSAIVELQDPVDGTSMTLLADAEGSAVITHTYQRRMYTKQDKVYTLVDCEEYFYIEVVASEGPGSGSSQLLDLSGYLKTSDAANEWQAVDERYQGNEPSNKDYPAVYNVTDTSGSNDISSTYSEPIIRVQKNVIPAGIENEFYVYLSVDKPMSLAELLSEADFSCSTNANRSVGDVYLGLQGSPSILYDDSFSGGVEHKVYFRMWDHVDSNGNGYNDDNSTDPRSLFSKMMYGSTPTCSNGVMQIRVPIDDEFKRTDSHWKNSGSKFPCDSSFEGGKWKDYGWLVASSGVSLKIDNSEMYVDIPLDNVLANFDTHFTSLYDDVVDQMGENIEFIGVEECDGEWEFASGTLTWSPMENQAVRASARVWPSRQNWYHNVIQMVYKIRLTVTDEKSCAETIDSPAASKSAGDYFPTNNYANVKYTRVNEVVKDDSGNLTYLDADAEKYWSRFQKPSVRGLLYDLRIEKADKVDDTRIAGAGFELYAVDPDVYTDAAPIAAGSTDTDGVLEFVNLPYNADADGEYWLKEAIPAERYKAVGEIQNYTLSYTIDPSSIEQDGTPYADNMAAIAPYDDPDKLLFYNEPIAIELRKYDKDTQTVMKGVKFRFSLTSALGYDLTLSSSELAKKISDGELEEITSEGVVTGYKSVADDEEVSVYIIDAAKDILTGTTDEYGIVRWSKIMAGTYELEETETPTGYSKLDKVTIVIDGLGNITSVSGDTDVKKLTDDQGKDVFADANNISYAVIKADDAPIRIAVKKVDPNGDPITELIGFSFNGASNFGPATVSDAAGEEGKIFWDYVPASVSYVENDDGTKSAVYSPYTLKETGFHPDYLAIDDAKVIVNEDGTVTVAELNEDGTLKLDEDGKPVASARMDVTAAGETTRTVSGKQYVYKQILVKDVYRVNLAIKKFNEETGAVLQGAGFILTQLTETGNAAFDASKAVPRTGTTGSDGYIHWTELKPGTYKLAETTVPAGFTKIEDTVITVNADGTVEFSGDDGISLETSLETYSDPAETPAYVDYKFNVLDIQDEPIHIALLKVDPENDPITEKIGFSLGNTAKSYTAATVDTEGMIYWDYVPASALPYLLKETGFHEEYLPIEDASLLVSEDGTVTVAELNEDGTLKLDKDGDPVASSRADVVLSSDVTKEVDGHDRTYHVVKVIDAYRLNLAIDKTDADTGVVLKGAEFTLTQLTEDGNDDFDADTAVPKVGITDENGAIRWKDLTAGDYTISETKVPSGYAKVTDISFHLNSDRTVTISTGNGNVTVASDLLTEESYVYRLMDIADTPIRVAVLKVDPKGNPITEDVKFSFTGAKSFGPTAVSSAEGEEGMIFWDYVPASENAYTLDETEWPEELYLEIEDAFVKVNEDGSIKLMVKDESGALKEGTRADVTVEADVTRTVDEATYTYRLIKVVDKYSFIDIIPKKTDHSETIALGGAKFTIYGTKTVGNESVTVGGYITGDDGYFSVDGDFTGTSAPVTDHKIRIYQGEYFIEETKAPTGFLLAPGPWKIIVGEDKVSLFSYEDNYAVAIAVFDANEDSLVEADLIITDSNGKSLPHTGGRGTGLYTTLGLVMLITAGSLLYISARRRNSGGGTF